MFENSLVVSQVNRTSSGQRWTVLTSMSLQFALAALVIAVPLLQPEELTFRVDVPHILMPLSPKPPIPIEHVQTSSASPSAFAPAAQSIRVKSLLPSLLSQNKEAPPISMTHPGMEMDDGLPNGLGIADAVRAPRIAVVTARPANDPVRVSSGVSAGMLMAPIRPVYPEIAKIAHVQGTVVVEATISRTGTVESLQVVSGPAMLQQAALEAIRGARYEPYRLNGNPTEVQTTISINFRLGN